MTVTWIILGAAVLTGFLGGVHCAGMCGGIVAAVVRQPAGKVRPWLIQLAYNAGRITSYALAGAAAGALGSLGLMLDKWLPVQIVLYVAANLLLIALGLYLAGIRGPITHLEHLGAGLWRHIQPFTRRFLPADSIPKAVALGMLWGWLPCGLVYTVLFTALLSGSALNGAILMLAFGLGTLPNLMAAAILLQRSRSLLTSKAARMISAATVMGFGLYGVAHAVSLGAQIRRGLLCIG
ncbi:MAG: sulfite exporter TauE/SafE family protein [Betaproteobacteria bacterium]